MYDKIYLSNSEGDEPMRFIIRGKNIEVTDGLREAVRPSWFAPQAWLSFIELDKAVVLV